MTYDDDASADPERTNESVQLRAERRSVKPKPTRKGIIRFRV
jgi:hypothetical protein